MSRTPRSRGSRPVRTISATTAAKSFGSLIDHVRSERAEYVVERGGSAAVRIVPVSVSRCTGGDLIRIVRELGSVDREYLQAVESGVAALNKPSVPKNRWES